MDYHDVPAERVCLCCAHPLYDDLGRLVCILCERSISDGLAEVARLWARLPDRLEKGTSGAAADEPRVATSKVDPDLPGNSEALDLLAGGVVGKLIVHEDAWRRELRRTIRPQMTLTPFRGNQTQTLRGVLVFLRTWLRWACQSYDGIADLEQDLYGLLRRMRTVVTGERPKKVTPLPVPCPLKPTGKRPCGGELVFDPATKHITCRACRGDIGHEHWADIGLAGGLIVLDLPAA